MGGKQIILSVLLLCSLVACSSRAVREAQEVVAQADSMWYAGEMYRDSAQLAQAYQTLRHHPLSSFRMPFSDSYLHACYHYGRLLREKDDPVSAMQAFINATHSRSRDYHFLGRVYSNMGDIAHLASEFEVAYDMYERSGKMYLCNGDTLFYFYDLNNMAFELAELKDTSCVRHLIDSIQSYNNPDVFIKTQETLAMMHLRNNQYAATIDLINIMQANGYVDLYGYLMKSQAFEHLGIPDSALYNARMITSKTNECRYLVSAYYILSHEDKSLSADSVLALTSLRADAQRSWALRHAEYANAVQLLEQDLTRKPSWTWLYSMIATLLIVGTCIWIYVHHKRNRLKLISQHINVLENIETETIAQMRNKLESNCALLKTSQHISKDLCWKDYEQTCRIIDQQFYLLASKLRSKKGLNETETRLCILVLIGFNEKDISCILPYASNSVGKLKYRTSQKLGTTSKNLRKYLIAIAIDEPVE